MRAGDYKFYRTLIDDSNFSIALTFSGDANVYAPFIEQRPTTGMHTNTRNAHKVCTGGYTFFEVERAEEVWLPSSPAVFRVKYMNKKGTRTLKPSISWFKPAY